MLDASFIKAWSTRDPVDNQTGYSDSDARVGRTGRTFGLGYKLHLSIDSKSMLPLSSLFASANQNEKKHSLAILAKAKAILERSGAKLRSVIADSQNQIGSRQHSDSLSCKPEKGRCRRFAGG